MQNISLFFLRIAMGFMFLYAGLTKVLDSSWSAEGYIKGAKVLPQLFHYFLAPGTLPAVNLLNEWGLVLLGVSLILGVFVRISAPLGAILMVLYYLAAFEMPKFGVSQSFFVDQHIIYIGALAVLAAFNAGKSWGLGNKIG
jgi:thiosulfate dehydrogenase [quinone] large subunit